MEDLLGMKGIGHNVMTLLRADGRVVRLVSYADGSWSILRNGALCGVWEASEEESCLKAFLRQSGRLDPATAVIFAKGKRQRETADASLN